MYSALLDALASYLASDGADYVAHYSGKALINELRDFVGWQAGDAAWFGMLRGAVEAGVLEMGRGDMPVVFGGAYRMAASEYGFLNAEFHWVRIL